MLVTTKEEFLANVAVFRKLDGPALRGLAQISAEYEFDKDAVIAYQWDVADSLTIVKAGRLFARSAGPSRDGPVLGTNAYEAYQYFDDVWLFAPGIHAATVTASSDGRVIIIKGSDFLRYLQNNPQVVDKLAPGVDEETGEAYGLSAAAWENARKLRRREKSVSRGVALLPEEYIEFFARRSKWYLVGQIIPPVLIMLLALALLIFLPADMGLFSWAKWLVPLLLAIGAVVFLAIRLVDWYKDYFVITNMHLTKHEFIFRQFRVELTSIPVGRVQSIEVAKPTFFANFLDIGTARITTAAMGAVLFDYIDEPLRVKETLNRLSGRVKSVDAAQIRGAMRTSLETHFEQPPFLRPTSDEQTPATPPATPRKGLWRRFRDRYSWRVVEGNTITYRKNIFVLIRYALLPLITLILLIALSTFILSSGSVGPVIIGLLGLFLLANLAWLTWQIENWRNDIFQLTDRYVIDIDREPFGFGESRKQAELVNVQNVHALRPGLLATIFNFGNVSIDTAGARADIVFESISNPSKIQSDIFRRLEEVRQRERIREGTSRRQEYAVLIDVYRQAMEKHRIPPRMPTED